MIGGNCVLMSQEARSHFLFLVFSIFDIWCEERLHVFPLRLYLYL